jgi:hypothetical protein
MGKKSSGKLGPQKSGIINAKKWYMSSSNRKRKEKQKL